MFWDTIIVWFFLIAFIAFFVLFCLYHISRIAGDGRKREVAIDMLSARFRGAKIFKEWIETPIAINKNGDIAFFNHDDVRGFNIDGAREFNIKDVNGFEVLVGKEGVQRGLIGALLGGGKSVKVDSISLLFKMNDFDNPVIRIPLLSDGDDDGVGESLLEEITELISTLEYVEKNLKT